MGDWITRRAMLLGLAAVAMPAIPATAGQAAQQTPQQIVDKFALVDPGVVQLKNFLGERSHKNDRARLRIQAEAELLDGLRSRPGQAPRAGEHAGMWLQAATLAQAFTKDGELKTKLDRVAAALIATQGEDGSLGARANGAPQAAGGEEKWDVWGQRCGLLGLLTYAAYTGNSAALDAAKKIGDLLVRTFGREGQLNVNERGLVSGGVLEPVMLLHRATGDEKHLDFARFLVERWEDEMGPKLVSALTTQRSVRQAANGRAYEMLLCLSGLCELYRTTGEAKYLIPAGNAWQDVVANHLLPTGSGGSRGQWSANRQFPSDAGDEPAETCVTVAWMQLNTQLLRLTGEAKYADELEKTVYNHLAAAQRPDGAAWTAFTPLAGVKAYSTALDRGASAGPAGWAMTPAFAYANSGDGIVVNLFAPGAATLQIKGKTVLVKQETNYPLDGRVAVTITTPEPMKFALRFRVPSWSNLNGLKAKPGEYWLLRQTWSKTQTITFHLDLPVRRIPGEGAQAGKFALARGPQVLAVDRLYNPDLGPLSAYAPATEKPQLTVSATYRDPDGLPVYETEAVAIRDTDKHKAGARVTLRFVAFSSAGAHGHEYHVWL
jgi:uncharacterized protein